MHFFIFKILISKFVIKLMILAVVSYMSTSFYTTRHFYLGQFSVICNTMCNTYYPQSHFSVVLTSDLYSISHFTSFSMTIVLSLFRTSYSLRGNLNSGDLLVGVSIRFILYRLFSLHLYSYLVLGLKFPFL